MKGILQKWLSKLATKNGILFCTLNVSVDVISICVGGAFSRSLLHHFSVINALETPQNLEKAATTPVFHLKTKLLLNQSLLVLKFNSVFISYMQGTITICSRVWISTRETKIVVKFQSLRFINSPISWITKLH